MHPIQNLTGPAADTDETHAVTPADILRGAATYLGIHGWTQHVYYGGTTDDVFPPACADGAIGMAAFGHATPHPGGEIGDPAYRDYNQARWYLSGYLRQIGYKPPCDPWCDGGDACGCVNDEPEIVFAFNDDGQCVKKDVLRVLNAAADDYERTHTPAPVLDDEPDVDLLLDSGGYLACGCHGSQRDHTCGPRD